MLCKFVPLLVLIALLDVAYPKKIICNLNDSPCVTKNSQKQYPTLISGLKELGLGSLDPVKKDIIRIESSSLNLTLTDAYLYGLKSCKVREVRFHEQHSNYDIYLECPDLTLKSQYEINGKICSLDINGKGDAQIVYDTYGIKSKGDYVIIKLDDGNHIKLKNYIFDSEVKGKVKYNFTNLYDGDVSKSAEAHKLMEGNWSQAKEFMQNSMLDSFMKVLMDQLNIFLDVIPIEELFSYQSD